MSAYAPAPNAYRESAVLTATPEQLVVMLYDGANRFLTQSAIAMRDGRAGLAGEKLRRAEAIIDELLATLDMSAARSPSASRRSTCSSRSTSCPPASSRTRARSTRSPASCASCASSWAAVAGA